MKAAGLSLLGRKKLVKKTSPFQLEEQEMEVGWRPVGLYSGSNSTPPV